MACMKDAMPELVSGHGLPVVGVQAHRFACRVPEAERANVICHAPHPHTRKNRCMNLTFGGRDRNTIFLIRARNDWIAHPTG